MGHTLPPVDGLDALRQQLRELARQVAELQRPDGTQNSDALQQLRDLVDGILAQTDINATGNANIGGTLTATAGISSTGVYNLDVSTLPGSRRTNWTNVNGAIGYAPSTRRKKTRIRRAGYKAAQFLAVIPYLFEYIAQREIRDDPDNPYFDPTYVVPTEHGVMAEQLIENGLEDFVNFDEETGEPTDVDYAGFAALAVLTIGADHEARLRALEGR